MNEIIRPKKYYDVQGTLLTATFDELNKLAGTSSGVSASTFNLLSGLTVFAAQLNNILYGSAIFKYAIGSTLASDSMILSHGLTSSIYCVVNAQTGGVITGGHASGSTIQFYIQANAGLFFTTTSATVDWIVFGS